MEASRHVPVLLEEVLAGLNIRPGVWVIDGTLGGGGHTAAFLEHSAPNGRVLGLDADPAAVQRAANRHVGATATRQLIAVHANYSQIQEVAERYSFLPVDAILLDLGISSDQLESAQRGFSLMHEGPLDMRMDPTQELTAASIVNRWTEQELADVLYRYGEERQSRRIARTLVRARPIDTTAELAALVERAVGGRRGERIHPATRTFQALRIAVNHELEHLERTLPQALRLLKPGGRLGVISFHSLEDRIVKQWMQQEASNFISDPTYLYGGVARTPTVRAVTRKPITSATAEVERNPRSRSAKLRIAERIA
jgi:16S rRNA (cytosine1402-N4)-methyltransferase